MTESTGPNAPDPKGRDRSDPPDDGAAAQQWRDVAGSAAVRRAPRYRAFVLVGTLLALGLAVVLVLVVQRDAGGGAAPATGTVLLFVGLTAAVVGALAGGLVAVLVDRRGRRSAAGRRGD